MTAPSHPVVAPGLIGTYPAETEAGGGYVWDAVLEYRVWSHPERGAPDLADGSDYYHGFEIAGCHAPRSLRWEVEVEQYDEDFFLFAMISSETETLPTGAERDQWAPAALAELEPEIQEAIEWALPQAVVACRSVVQRFGPDGSGSGSA